MKKIRVHPDLAHQISKEFSVTYQTVQMSLRYVFHSDTAEKIRQRAKELLEKEASNINNFS